MGTEFLKIKDSEEAKDIIQSFFNKYYVPKKEEVSVEDAYGRILFEDIYSVIDFPPFDRALKDGFAIKAEDSFGASEENPKTIEVIDFIEAGSVSDKVVEKGKCIEISTGAALPEGANAVAMVEYTLKENNHVDLLKSVTPSLDVAKKGSDITKGNIIMKKGDFLNHAKIGVLLSQGFEKVSVYKKPVVGIVSTGNELINQDEELRYGKIYDVNSNMIKSGVIAFGGNGKSLGIVNDDFKSLKSKFTEYLEEVDILLCSGGTSAGRGDVVGNVLEELGEVYIHGISVQPGKPTILGIVNNKCVIGLPGNPVSAVMIFNVFVGPIISKLAGIKVNKEIKTFKTKISKRIHSPIGREQYQLVTLEDGLANPIFKDSGAIFSLSTAKGYIKVPKTVELLDEGEDVIVYLFD